MVRHLHHQQVALGNPGNQIGPAGNPQVGAAGLNNRIVMGKQPHQLLRTAFTGGKEDRTASLSPFPQYWELRMDPAETAEKMNMFCTN